MDATSSGLADRLEAIRKRFAGDQAFRREAETDLQGTLRKAGLSEELLNRFVFSETDENGRLGKALRADRKQIWICEIDGDSKRCWCTNCDYP